MKMTSKQSTKNRILLILTGGTICSFADERGERGSDTSRAQALIVENFRSSTSSLAKTVTFDPVCPLDNITNEIAKDYMQLVLGYYFIFFVR